MIRPDGLRIVLYARSHRKMLQGFFGKISFAVIGLVDKLVVDGKEENKELLRKS